MEIDQVNQLGTHMAISTQHPLGMPKKWKNAESALFEPVGLESRPIQQRMSHPMLIMPEISR